VDVVGDVRQARPHGAAGSVDRGPDADAGHWRKALRTA
jgi:hypothetical protein